MALRPEADGVHGQFLHAVGQRVRTLGDFGLDVDERIRVRKEWLDTIDRLVRMTGKSHASLHERVERAAAVVHEEATLAARTFTL